MTQELFNGMLAILLAKFCLNDLPHAAGLTESDYERPPTTRQLRYIGILRQQLKITVVYEEQVRTLGEAGTMIRKLEAEREYRKRQKELKSGNPITATGTCYRDAWRYVMHHTDAVLVHGAAISLGKRINHAWVELPDGTVWEPASQAIFPIEKFYQLVDPIVEDRYTSDEAASMLSVGKHGPWNAEERMKHIGR